MCYEFLENLCGKKAGDGNLPKEVNSVRVFAVSPVNPRLSPDAALYQIQDKNKKDKSSQKKVTIKGLHDYIQQHYAMEMTLRMLIDKKNVLISKMIQNLYVSSLGGITAKSMKVYRIQLMINATNDLPNIDDEKIEMLRVPMTTSDPFSVEPYLDDVADKIQASSFKNISTLVYCYDGMCNSLVLVACYFIKYTDLMLFEITQHLAFSRRGYHEEDGFGCYTEMVVRFARKYRKIAGADGSSTSGMIMKPQLVSDAAQSNESNSATTAYRPNPESGDSDTRRTIGEPQIIKTNKNQHSGAEKSYQSVPSPPNGEEKKDKATVDKEKEKELSATRKKCDKSTISAKSLSGKDKNAKKGTEPKEKTTKGKKETTKKGNEHSEKEESAPKSCLSVPDHSCVDPEDKSPSKKPKSKQPKKSVKSPKVSKRKTKTKTAIDRKASGRKSLKKSKSLNKEVVSKNNEKKSSKGNPASQKKSCGKIQEKAKSSGKKELKQKTNEKNAVLEEKRNSKDAKDGKDGDIKAKVGKNSKKNKKSINGINEEKGSENKDKDREKKKLKKIR